MIAATWKVPGVNLANAQPQPANRMARPVVQQPGQKPSHTDTYGEDPENPFSLPAPAPRSGGKRGGPPVAQAVSPGGAARSKSSTEPIAVRNARAGVQQDRRVGGSLQTAEASSVRPEATARATSVGPDGSGLGVGGSGNGRRRDHHVILHGVQGNAATGVRPAGAPAASIPLQHEGEWLESANCRSNVEQRRQGHATSSQRNGICRTRSRRPSSR